MKRIAATILSGSGALALTARLALAGPCSTHNSYWDWVERQQECAWHGGYAWGAPEYPCWNHGPQAHFGTWRGPYTYGYYGYPYPYGYAYPYHGYGWR